MFKTSVKTKNQTRQRSRRKLLGMGLFAATAMVSPFVIADTWPSRPIKLIVSFPPGNSADLVARSFGPLLSQRLGQPVVIDNKGGAGGVIGMEAMSKSAPDGYTFAVSSLSPITIIPAVKKKLPYDPVNGLMPVTLLGKGPMFILVKRDSPINSISELIAKSKANPDAYTYGSLGPGTISQMGTEVFKAASGSKLTEISYKGSSQALTDLVGGHISMMIDGAASSAAQINAGTVKALAVTTLKRSPIVPDVVTLDESGIPGLAGFDVFGWIGMFAPVGTPKEIVARMQTELSQIGRTPTVIQQLRTGGLDVPDTNSPTQFGDFLQQDLARWTKVATDLKIIVND